MAKKKKTPKKHNFKHTATMPTASTEPNASAAPVSAPAGRPSSVAAVAVGRDFGYVARDVRRIAIWAISLIAVEVLLWLAFGHTGLGNAVYRLVNV